jgi:hypothetical protein
MQKIGPVAPQSGPHTDHAWEEPGSLEGGVSILLAAPLLDQPQKHVAVARPRGAPARKHLALQLREAVQQLGRVAQALFVAPDGLLPAELLGAEGVGPRRRLEELLAAELSPPDVHVEGGTGLMGEVDHRGCHLSPRGRFDPLHFAPPVIPVQTFVCTHSERTTGARVRGQWDAGPGLWRLLGDLPLYSSGKLRLLSQLHILSPLVHYRPHGERAHL